MRKPLTARLNHPTPPVDPPPVPIKLEGAELARDLKQRGTTIFVAQMAVAKTGYRVTVDRKDNHTKLCIESTRRPNIFGRGGGKPPPEPKKVCIDWG